MNTRYQSPFSFFSGSDTFLWVQRNYLTLLRPFCLPVCKLRAFVVDCSVSCNSWESTRSLNPDNKNKRDSDSSAPQLSSAFLPLSPILITYTLCFLPSSAPSLPPSLPQCRLSSLLIEIGYFAQISGVFTLGERILPMHVMKNTNGLISSDKTLSFYTKELSERFASSRQSMMTLDEIEAHWTKIHLFSSLFQAKITHSVRHPIIALGRRNCAEVVSNARSLILGVDFYAC